MRTTDPFGIETRRGARRRKGVAAEKWGRAAEAQIAARYEALGGQVVARRAETEAGEIDLVVALGGALVFVEVRARKTLAEAAESVTPEKLARVAAAAECFLAATNPLADARVDVAAVDRSGAVALIENVTLH